LRVMLMRVNITVNTHWE